MITPEAWTPVIINSCEYVLYFQGPNSIFFLFFCSQQLYLSFKLALLKPS